MSEKELDTTATKVEFELATISLEDGTAQPANAGNGTKALYPDLYSPDDGEADPRKLQMSPTPVCEGITWIKVWQRLELGALVAVILVVWGLLLLPIVFYHLPSDEEESGCVVYNTADSLCQEALQDLQTCLPNGRSSSEIYVSPGDRTQEEIESIILIGKNLATSPECERAVVPFLCQYFFSPCDSSGESYLPSSEECRVVSTEICPTEWQLANNLPGVSLPSCDTLPETSLSCNRTLESDNMTSSGSGDAAILSGDFPMEPMPNSTIPVQPMPNSTIQVQPMPNPTECAVYEGQACKDALLGVQNCLSDRIGSDDVYIPLGRDQEEMENQAALIIASGLNLIGASPECKERAIPFLCVYYFGLCDSSGIEYQSSMEECISVSTGICQAEWITANRFLPGRLPTCESLLESSIPCARGILAVVESNEPDTNPDMDPDDVDPDMDPADMDPDVDPDVDPDENPDDVDPDEDPDIDSQSSSTNNCTSTGRACREAFYCESGVCLPRCDEWEQYTHGSIVAADVTVTTSAAIGLITGIVVLVLSFIRWKRVFTFPSVIVVYQTISMIVLALFVLISYTDRPELYCSSQDLIKSIDDPTAFCVLSGVVFYYVLLQLAILWIIHVVVLFWKLRFPFHARTFGTPRRLVYMHIITVIIAILGPLVPVIATFAGDGFGLTRFPPILCTGTEGDPTFYTLVLPIIVMLQIGITLLIVIFWVIHKQHGLFKAKQSKAPFKIGTAERKILILFCYYVVLGVIALTSFTLVTRDVEEFTDEVTKYFICEAAGFDPDNPCSRRGFEDLAVPAIPVLSYILLGLFPAINLIFAINLTELKQICGRARQFHFHSNTSTSSGTASASIKRMDSRLSKMT